MSGLTGHATDQHAQGLSDLPEPVLLLVLRSLEARDLARLCVQYRCIRSVASLACLWEPLAVARWTSCDASHYHGDWKRLYGVRAGMPAALVGAIDRCHALTTKAQGNGQVRMNGASLPGTPSASPGASPVKSNVYGFAVRPFSSVPAMLAEDVMRSVLTVGLCQASFTAAAAAAPSTSSLAVAHAAAGGGSTCSNSSSSTRADGGACGSQGSVSSSGCSGSGGAALGTAGRGGLWAHPEMALHRSDLLWWLTERPEPIMRFARSVCEEMRQWDMWAGGLRSWPEIPWRRSALAYLVDQARSLPVCPSVVEQLESAARRIDVTVRQLAADSVAGELAVCKPAGMPTAHWWWDVRGELCA